jgi:serine protease Do
MLERLTNTALKVITGIVVICGLFLAGLLGGPWICGLISSAGSSNTLFEFSIDAGPPYREVAGVSSDRPDYLAQQFGRRVARYPGDEGKNHTKIKEVFTSVVAPSKASTVRVICDNIDVTLGTVVDSDGLILTKASELNGIIHCQFADGKKLPVTVLGVSRENDMALLKVKAKNLTPVQWRANDLPKVGSFLSTVGLSNEPIAFGVMSVSAREIRTPKGFLGVELADDDDGPRINRVIEGSAADQAGLLANDVVMKINDTFVKTRQGMIEFVASFRPGDKLQLLVQRGGTQFDIAATLGGPDTIMTNSKRPRGTDIRLAGELSDRRAGFPQAIQHDTVLHPEQCGGPLVDLDGKTVGINIARADRVSTYAIPAKVVLDILPDLKSGKLSAPIELRGDNKDRFALKVKQLDQLASKATSEKGVIEAKLETLKKALPESATEADKKKASDSISLQETMLRSAAFKERKANESLKNAKEQMKKLTSES